MNYTYIPLETTDGNTFLTLNDEIFNVKNVTDGSIQILLYKNSAEPHRVDKTNYLESVGTLFGVLREEFSITSGSITISADIINFNYIYIPIFNRYYFVTEVTSLQYGLWDISIEVDVLMTYKDALYQCIAFIDRNEFAESSDIIDEKRVIEQGYDITVQEISNAVFTNDKIGCYLISGLGFASTEISEESEE